MVSRNLLRQLDSFSEGIEADLLAIFPATEDWLPAEADEFAADKIVTGRVRKVSAESVWVDVGFKSEGIIELREWHDHEANQMTPPKVGDLVDVLVETIDDGTGAIVLSYRRAKRHKAWELIIATAQEGDTVSGAVSRKIKGGLLVNIGINVFLPASQIDVRRTADVGEYLGKTIECKIMVIDREKRNIIVSRRRLIEDQRIEMRAKLLADIEPGQIRSGVVKNLASFGAFVDLGGIDGLLHIADMAWHRVERPEDIVRIDEKIEVYVIKVDKITQKIGLGIKQKTPSPWLGVAERYPIGSRHRGEIGNLASFGAFVKLESGVEGLVHISEMSWTKRIGHPSEVVRSGDSIEVEILGINQKKQEISLGIKQTSANPWSTVAEKYPPGAVTEGIVQNLTEYGAFIEIEEGIDGLLHVNDMSWTRKIAHPKEVLTKGEKVRCVILDVEPEKHRIGLGLKQLVSDPWLTDIPERFGVGDMKSGTVTKVTNFGIFVEFEAGLEGLLHVSEVDDTDTHRGAIKAGESIDVCILRVDVEGRKIALSGKKTDQSSINKVDPLRAKKSTLRGGVASGGINLEDLNIT